MSETPLGSYESRVDATEMNADTILDLHTSNLPRNPEIQARNLADKAFEAQRAYEDQQRVRVVAEVSRFMPLLRRQALVEDDQSHAA